MFKKYSLKEILEELVQSIRLSLPLIAMEMLYGVSFFLSATMVASLGKEAMAINVIAWTISLTLMVFSVGTLGAVSVLSSQSCGAGEWKAVGIIFRQGILLSVIYSIPMIAIMLSMPELLLFFKQEAEIVASSRPYFYAFTLAILPFNLCIMLEQYLIGINESKIALLTSILCIPIEIFFFYAFIFGKFGFPHCGIAGVPYGLASAMTLTTSILLIYLYLAKRFKKYALYEHILKLNWGYLWEMLRVGMPIGCMFSLELALFAAITLLMGTLGRDVVAAHQIAMQCTTFAMSLSWGVSQAATVRTGYEVGQGNKHALKLTAYVNIITGMIMMSFVSLLYIFRPDILIDIDIDTSNEEFVAVAMNAKLFLSIAAFLMIADCLRVISFSILRGLKDTKFAFYISLITFWCIAFPLAYIFGIVLEFGGTGVWVGLLCGLTIGGVFNLLRFLTIINKVNLQKMITRNGNS